MTGRLQQLIFFDGSDLFPGIGYYTYFSHLC